MENNLIEILTYFVIYSFLGWVMESIVRSIAEKKLINTGFLHGPYCPIYGVGALIMMFFLQQFENKIAILFIASILILTIWEYIVGVFLETVFKTKYWDYSDQKFNIQGRVCLLNSIAWGVLGVIFVKILHPTIENVLKMINPQIIKYFTYIVSTILFTDMIISVIKMLNIKTTLDKIEELNKQIKEKIKEIRKENKIKEKKDTIDNIKEIVKDLKKKRNRIILRLYRNVYRLKKAFPDINTKEITEILTQNKKRFTRYKKKRKYRNKKKEKRFYKKRKK